VMLTVGRKGCLGKAIIAFAFGLVGFWVGALEEFPEDLRDDPNLPREVRIQRHMARMQQILAENRAREEAQRKAATENQQNTLTGQQLVVSQPPQSPSPGSTPAAPSPTSPTPPGPVSPTMAMRPGLPGMPPQPGAPSPPVAGAQSQVSFRVSRAIVYIHPFQGIARVGDTFQTEVRVFNSSGGPFDEIALRLKYDPLVAAPERVNDAPIYKLLDGSPELHINRSKGELHYLAQLHETIAKTTTTLLTIHWRALNPVHYSEIGFIEGDEGTRVGRDERNLLGFVAAGKQEGGTLPGILVVIPRDDSPRKIVSPLAEIAVASIDERVELFLDADPESVAKGKDWVVNLMLRNKAAVPFNNLRVRMLFDPEKLQVLDWHQGNWIRQGINIYDGFAHETYPFDVFRANAADNERGEIIYHVGTRAACMFPSGVFAKIKFRTLADVSLDDLWFDFEDPKRSGETVETDVSFLGSSVMFAPRRQVEADQRPAPEPLRKPI